MKLALSHDFPHSPPKGYFMTKIFHPNVASNGEICVNTLKKDWNPSLGLRHVLSPNNETPGAIPSSVADINRVITATEQIANVPVAAAAGSASVATTTQKREAGLAKVQADKKKVDARKKSLKRL
ncbi:hypothetical protein HID58_089795 [Brassica napus]|uniref:UBC core domain-containing protein n=1 Tax=Brassica napus TaxID=3708 RepID=A0ABQ7Y024_BRANA|nr:hypothetical protein HID58_089795 [Brassica napus]